MMQKIVDESFNLCKLTIYYSSKSQTTMKKTLMVLSFALCATLAFAQTATPYQGRDVKAAAKTAQIQSSQNSSIFTKDETVIKTVDFSGDNLDYTTGIVTTGVEAHAQNYNFATWRRIANVDDATLTAQAETYPALVTWFGGSDGVEGFVETFRNLIDTAVSSGENGFMMMSMRDQTTPMSGNFNAFIRINNIDATQAEVVDISFYQYYMKYYDNNYVDYSLDGQTWVETEVNVRGIDVDVNSSLRGFYRYSLPIAIAGNNNVSIRIRWKSLDASTRNAYGYVWMLDDVSLIAAEPNRMKQLGTQEYSEGNYGLIPQGLKINPAWYALVENNGAYPRNNVTATIHHLNAAQDTDTPVASYNNQTLAVGDRKGVIVDKAGWYLPDSLDYIGWYGYTVHNPNGTGIDLPTTTAGDNYMYVDLTSGDATLGYDTMYYNVTTNTNGFYRWGHDNGVLVYLPNNYWMFGYVQSGQNWFVTEDPEEVHFYSAGYQVTSRFTTDAQVPDGWVIRGVELVASPNNNYHNTGSVISAVLLQDAYEGGSVGFRTIVTGANVKQVSSSEINDSTIIGRNSYGYRELGQYNSIIIPFPEQPALEPYTSYRVGYSIEEDSYFALAHEATGSYRLASPTRPERYDTILYFANNEATAKYANYHIPNDYQNFVLDPGSGRDDYSTFAWHFVTFNPMIRLLVGPAQAVNRVHINVECDSTEYGSAVYAGEEVCGVELNPAEGSSVTIHGVGANGCSVAHCYVDGVEVEPWDAEEETGDPALRVEYDRLENSYTYSYTFSNLSEDHTIKFVFTEIRQGIGIDPIADNVKMSLQPNPATSQVRLSLEGVNGMVNCALIDMSGRVVYNQNINAENSNVINLSSLAKGAYFVRITNEQFTKVEKLIVR
jgi:hypothetical protein